MIDWIASVLNWYLRCDMAYFLKRVSQTIWVLFIFPLRVTSIRCPSWHPTLLQCLVSFLYWLSEITCWEFWDDLTPWSGYTWNYLLNFHLLSGHVEQLLMRRSEFVGFRIQVDWSEALRKMALTISIWSIYVWPLALFFLFYFFKFCILPASTNVWTIIDPAVRSMRNYQQNADV